MIILIQMVLHHSRDCYYYHSHTHFPAPLRYHLHHLAECTFLMYFTWLVTVIGTSMMMYPHCCPIAMELVATTISTAMSSLCYGLRLHLSFPS